MLGESSLVDFKVRVVEDIVLRLVFILHLVKFFSVDFFIMLVGELGHFLTAG